MDFNVIFLSPLSDFLKQLSQALPEKEDFAVYQLDSIDEYRQVVDFLPKSITFTSDLKMTQSYLKLVDEVKSPNSYNILLSDRDIPLTLDVKLCSDGLDQVLSEKACEINTVKTLIVDYFSNMLIINENLLTKTQVANSEKKTIKKMRLERGISDAKKSMFDFSKKKPFSIRDPEINSSKKWAVKDLKAISFEEKRDESAKDKQEVYLYNLKKIKLNKEITEVERVERYEMLLNTYIEEYAPPQYTVDILKASPQKLEDLIEENFDRYLGNSSNLEFLVFVSEFYKYKEPDNVSITRFIHLSLNSLVESQTSFFRYDHDNDSVNLVHSYHTDIFFDDGDDEDENEDKKTFEMFVESLPEVIKDIKYEYFADPSFKSQLNYYIYPYFLDNTLLGFSLTHFESSKLSSHAKGLLESFSSLAKGIFI